ncbi:MAG: PKD domain-containing protein, partial [Bacteroidota bacterium]
SDGTDIQTETKSAYIKVNGPLNADFSGTPLTLLAGNTVDFTDLTTGGNTITSWDWTFTGGTPGTSTSQNPTGILYSTPGTYTVSLLVTDNTSATDTETKTAYITVLDPNALMADFTADFTTIIQGGVVNFFDQSLNGPPTTWSWQFSGAVTTTSTDQNPSIQYDNIGTYTVSLTVNDGTNSSTEEKIGYITVVDSSFAPQADFIANYTTIMAGTSIDFFDLSTGSPINWDWAFPGADITSSTDQNPTMITYNNIGIYPVTLIIISAVGTDTLTKTDYIHVIDNSSLGPLEADFHALGSRLIVEGSTVSYEDLTIGYPTNWTWNFEGGTPLTSSTQNPLNILYTTPGFYDVELIVTNGIYSDTIIKPNYIVVSNEPWQDPLGFCDTISNLLSGEMMLGFRHLTPTTWGYFPGHNGYTVRAYAEKYTNYMFSNVQGILIPVVKAHSASTNAYVRFMIWDVDTNGMPGNTLAQKDVPIASFSPYLYHSVMFDDPVDINGSFFAGFNIYYNTPQDTFVVYMAPDRGIGGLNTLYIKKGTWKFPYQVLDDTLNTSMALDLIGCLVKVDEINMDDLINIYPNPVHDFVYVEVPSEYCDQMNIEMYDIFGRVVNYTQETDFAGPYKLKITNCSSGIYFIKICMGENTVTKKITVIK